MPKQSHLNRISGFLYRHHSPWVFRTYCVLVVVPAAILVLGAMETGRWFRNNWQEVISFFGEVWDWTEDCWLYFCFRVSCLIQIAWCHPDRRDALTARLTDRNR